jgi:hypothetical protein
MSETIIVDAVDKLARHGEDNADLWFLVCHAPIMRLGLTDVNVPIVRGVKPDNLGTLTQKKASGETCMDSTSS